MNLYRDTFPPFIDTICDSKIPLVNNSKIDSSFLDSVFDHLGTNRAFSLDTEGAYRVERSTIISVHGGQYEAAKVQYLANGQNVDQEFLLYVVQKKGIIIQQESHDRKLYLLLSRRNTTGQVEYTADMSEAIVEDTVLFPLPPKGP
jgi:hypothetical protein